ncbi:hypothetical protein ONZ43_g5289 [Nemania bipapillata]|uniref:Uncharacterized protein n=1 Tax=Nemania bipapillata TaxID=110536 RepID=A0ACC2ICJ2_9PEZI|nr:hypothetical protein ONZ43_g5289 [Nemania bipapillata]
MMVGLSRLSLIATIAAVSAQLQQLQQPLVSQSEDVLLEADKAATKPLVDTELLQARITTESLLRHAEALYGIAKSSEEEFGHPTRVIGSEGKPSSPGPEPYDASEGPCECQCP